MDQDSQKRIINILIVGIVLLALVFSVFWFLQKFHLVDKTSRDDISIEARRNPFLAAEIFLHKAGVEVESVSGRSRLHDLPPVGDILFINNFGPNLNEERYKKLLKWIKAGGHLITTAHKPWDSDKEKSGDQLLDELGVQLIDYYSDLDDEEDYDEDSISLDDFNITTTNIVEVPFDSGEIVKVNFNPNYTLIDSKEISSVQVSGEYGTHLLQIPLGKGIVTIMSDNQFLTNPNNFYDYDSTFSYFSTSIAKEDHAYYLWLLVGGNSKVWILYSLQTSGLVSFLWQNAQQACISLIALLIIWLWWQRNRFGPYRSELNQARRNYLEHILMAANFSWKQDKGQQMFENTREQFIHWLALKHPQLTSLSAEEQCEKIAELCDLSASKIYQALFGQWNTEREFIQLTFILQSLRKKL
jgi:Domain of unknown function (DUF4350)